MISLTVIRPVEDSDHKSRIPTDIDFSADEVATFANEVVGKITLPDPKTITDCPPCDICPNKCPVGAIGDSIKKLATPEFVQEISRLTNPPIVSN